MLWAIWCWCFERLNLNLDQQLHNYQNVNQLIVTTDITQIETLWILLNSSKMICFLKFGERASHEDVWMILISRSSIIHLFKPSKSCPFQTIVCKSAAQPKTTALTHDESRLVILIVECRCRANYSHGRLKTTSVEYWLI